jgi:hypothetical protein
LAWEKNGRRKISEIHFFQDETKIARKGKQKMIMVVVSKNSTMLKVAKN